MQNSSLKNEVLNKALIINLEWALTDPDDPDSGAYTFKKASMGPVALKTMLPPSFALIQVFDADDVIQGVEYAQGIFFDNDGSGLHVFTPDIMMDGTFATDSWEVHTE